MGAQNGHTARDSAARPSAPAPTLIDVFSGAGGGTIGFAAAGFRPVAAVEIDPHAAESYRLNTGLAPRIADIRTVSGSQLLRDADMKRGQLTLLFGCPPCQSFTVLRRGSKATTSDRARNRLPEEYLRLVGELLPQHVAFENVPGMAEGRWSAHFDELVGGLERLKYRVDFEVLDAADFGVPQRRRRLLVVASRGRNPRLPAPTRGPNSSAELPYVTVRDAIGELLTLESGEVDPKDPLHRARRHSQVVLDRLSHVPEGGGRADLPERLQLECHKTHGGHYDIYGRMTWDKVAPTLTSGCTNVTRGRFAHPDQNRAITVREALLLQTFPATTSLAGGIEAMSLQVGNAVPPLLSELIGRTLLRTA